MALHAFIPSVPASRRSCSGKLPGFAPTLAGPGFERTVIRPVLGNLTWARAKYDSIHGPITSDWKHEANRFSLRVTIPPNTTATIYLPAKNPDAISESGKPLGQALGVKFLRIEGSHALVAVDSGAYSFVAQLQGETHHE